MRTGNWCKGRAQRSRSCKRTQRIGLTPRSVSRSWQPCMYLRRYWTRTCGTVEVATGSERVEAQAVNRCSVMRDVLTTLRFGPASSCIIGVMCKY